MKSTTLENEALGLLRAMYDLGDADVPVNIDLLGRLSALHATRVCELVEQLRAAKLVQADTLRLTMVGLSSALSLPEFEPSYDDPAPRPRTSLHAA